MTERVNFRTIYSGPHQHKFNVSFVNGDLEEAYQILQNMPAALSNSERLQRTAALVQGYQALIDAYREELRDLEDNEPSEDKATEELEQYRELGGVEEISARIKRLEELEGLASELP